MEKRMIKIGRRDNVATALCDIAEGDLVSVYDENQTIVATLQARSRIPYGNKIALCPLEKGSSIVKYDEVVGVACRDIEEGALVHVHNVRSLHLDIPDEIIRDIIRIMEIE